jgi:5-methylcytosine-specific restriction endonuclease McrA
MITTLACFLDSFTPAPNYLEEKQMSAEHQRKYKEKYPERVKESKRKFREAHPERIKEEKRLAHENNPTVRVEYKRLFHLANPDARRQNRRAYRARGKSVYSKKYSTQDVLDLYGTDCHICALPIDLIVSRVIGLEGWELSLHLDHVIPMSKGGEDTLVNVKPSHGICNMKKSDTEIFEVGE